MGLVFPFSKWTGTQNDFIIVDGRKRKSFSRSAWAHLAHEMCQAKRGRGADGLLVLGTSRRADVQMRIFNPDGSEAEMCGNGIRCLAMYAHRLGKPARMTVETQAGVKYAEIKKNHRVNVNMGVPKILGTIPRSRLKGLKSDRIDFIDTGVPHLVCWVDRLRHTNVNRLGKRLRHHRRFQPRGTNVDFVEYVKTRDIYDKTSGRMVHHPTIHVRTYERGVEDETRACGTGAVAAAVSTVLAFPFWGMGRESNTESFVVTVKVPGGTLQVSLVAKYLFDQDRYLFSHAYLEGEARQVSKGKFHFDKRG